MDMLLMKIMYELLELFGSSVWSDGVLIQEKPLRRLRVI